LSSFAPDTYLSQLEEMRRAEAKDPALPSTAKQVGNVVVVVVGVCGGDGRT
jgi:hypothetical protein